jgi:hypothetical protein
MARPVRAANDVFLVRYNSSSGAKTWTRLLGTVEDIDV